MKPGRGHAKGAAWERQVCYDLSRFVDPKSTDTYFWRSAMSGGRATLHHRKGVGNETQLGDITCVSPKGQWLTSAFVFECKFWKDLDIQSSILLGKGKLASFWKQLNELASDKERQPLLIAKENRTKPLIILTKKGVNVLKTFGHPVRIIVKSYQMGTEEALVCFYEETFKNDA